MSTRSNVGMRTPDGIRFVYVHFDGYPSGVGRTLLRHYVNDAAVRALLAHGDMSRLSERAAPDPMRPHTFDRPQPGVCVYYGRDRGEEGTGARLATSREATHEQQYAYVWDDGVWWWCGHDGKWAALTDEDTRED